LGVHGVTGVDDNEEKISIFQMAFSRFEPPSGNIEAVRQDIEDENSVLDTTGQSWRRSA
jgi:predicted RNA methylase